MPKLGQDEAAAAVAERRQASMERWGVPRAEEADAPARISKPSGHPQQEREQRVAATAKEPALKLDKQALDYLEHVARHPFVGVRERNEQLGLSAWKGQRIKQSLIDAGRVNEVIINPGKRGERFKLLDLTSTGREVLAEYGIASPSGHGRGGLAHQWWVRIIADWLSGNGVEATIEDEALGARVDLAFAVNGKQVAVEVEMSEGHETANIEKNREAGFDRVVTLVDSSIQEERLSTWIEENDLVDLVSVCGARGLRASARAAPSDQGSRLTRPEPKQKDSG